MPGSLTRSLYPLDNTRQTRLLAHAIVQTEASSGPCRIRIATLHTLENAKAVLGDNKDRDGLSIVAA
jgi:hypothetical protein